MKKYKDVIVSKNSDLDKAIQISEQAAKKVYSETYDRYASLYSKADRDWFAAKSKE